MVALGTSLIVLGMAFLLSGLIFLLPKGWIMTRRQVRRDERASSGQAGRLNRSSVLSDVPAKATRVNRAGPGYKVIRLRRLSHTRQLQSSYPRPKSLDLLKRVVAVLSRWKLASGVCSENLIRVDDVIESPKLAE